jgi:hypothetical protein
MNKVQAILHLYPNAIPGVDFIVQDDSDGRGAYIAMWNLKDAQGNNIPQPSEEELQAAWEAYELPAVKAAKKAEISAAVAAKITSGYQSTVVLASTGKAHFYGTSLEDQQNMTAEYVNALAHPEITTVKYRPQDVIGRIDHTRNEFIQIAEAVKAFVTSKLDQGYALYEQLNTAQTVADVEAIQVNVV